MHPPSPTCHVPGAQKDGAHKQRTQQRTQRGGRACTGAADSPLEMASAGLIGSHGFRWHP